MSTGDTGVQEYKSSGIQEYQRSGHIIIMNMSGNTGATYNMSSTGVIYHVSSIAWQVPVLGIMGQI